MGLLALSMGAQSKAADMEDFVNSKIKEEFIKVEGEQLRASMDFPTPEDNLRSIPQLPRPMEHKDPALQNLNPTELGEQAGVGPEPRAG